MRLARSYGAGGQRARIDRRGNDHRAAVVHRFELTAQQHDFGAVA